jgi:hypothetical protein
LHWTNLSSKLEKSLEVLNVKSKLTPKKQNLIHRIRMMIFLMIMKFLFNSWFFKSRIMRMKAHIELVYDLMFFLANTSTSLKCFFYSLLFSFLINSSSNLIAWFRTSWNFLLLIWLQSACNWLSLLNKPLFAFFQFVYWIYCNSFPGQFIII